MSIELWEQKFDERSEYVAKMVSQVKRVSWFAYGWITGMMTCFTIFFIVFEVTSK